MGSMENKKSSHLFLENKEFCMEMFDGGKWQRQLYFNFIFGIEAQFLVW